MFTTTIYPTPEHFRVNFGNNPHHNPLALALTDAGVKHDGVRVANGQAMLYRKRQLFLAELPWELRATLRDHVAGGPNAYRGKREYELTFTSQYRPDVLLATIVVTENDMKVGQGGNCRDCPVALATTRALALQTLSEYTVKVYQQTFALESGLLTYVGNLPSVVRDFVNDFDRFQREIDITHKRSRPATQEFLNRAHETILGRPVTLTAARLITAY